MDLRWTRQGPSIPRPDYFNHRKPPNPLQLLPDASQLVHVPPSRLGTPKKHALQPHLWTAMSVPPAKYRHNGFYQNGKTTSKTTDLKRLLPTSPRPPAPVRPARISKPVPTGSLTTDDPSPKPLIFHLKYHPRGISRQQVRTAYSEMLESLMPERHLLIAVSRPKNLKDRLCSTIL